MAWPIECGRGKWTTAAGQRMFVTFMPEPGQRSTPASLLWSRSWTPAHGTCQPAGEARSQKLPLGRLSLVDLSALPQTLWHWFSFRSPEEENSTRIHIFGFAFICFPFGFSFCPFFHLCLLFDSVVWAWVRALGLASLILIRFDWAPSLADHASLFNFQSELPTAAT